MNCPCRWCENRSIECHSKCEKYIEWSEENSKMNEKIRQEKILDYLSRSDRPKRKHGRK